MSKFFSFKFCFFLSKIIGFRTTRGRLDFLGEIYDLRREYYDREKLTSLGWKKVEAVDGRGINSWDSIKNKFNVKERSVLIVENSWPKLPLARSNEKIVGLQECLIKGFRRGKHQDDLYNIGNLKLKNGDSGLHQEVGSYSGLCNSIGFFFVWMV